MLGLGAGTLYIVLDDAMLNNHHDWTSYVGNKIRRSKDFVWTIMVEEWIRTCLDQDVVAPFVNTVKTKLDELLK